MSIPATQMRPGMIIKHKKTKDQTERRRGRAKRGSAPPKTLPLVGSTATSSRVASSPPASESFVVQGPWRTAAVRGSSLRTSPVSRASQKRRPAELRDDRVPPEHPPRPRVEPGAAVGAQEPDLARLVVVAGGDEHDRARARVRGAGGRGGGRAAAGGGGEAEERRAREFERTGCHRDLEPRSSRGRREGRAELRGLPARGLLAPGSSSHALLPRRLAVKLPRRSASGLMACSSSVTAAAPRRHRTDFPPRGQERH